MPLGSLLLDRAVQPITFIRPANQFINRFGLVKTAAITCLALGVHQ
jgi:hypothetical protein